MIPVIDLKGGRAVHAQGGVRADYAPVRSVLYGGDDAAGLARAYREALGLGELYVADLGAIGGERPDFEVFRTCVEEGSRLWVDAGLRDGEWVEALHGAGVDTLIAATETLGGGDSLREIVRRAGAERVMFGLDMRGECALVGEGSVWRGERPEALIEEALGAGVRRFLILDVAGVGTGRGVGAPGFVRTLMESCPDVEIYLGGGVNGRGDLVALGTLGVKGVLVGSALHDGRLGREDVHEAGSKTHSTSAD